MDDKKLMGAAILKAKQGILRGQSPFGACIADGKGRIVACAHNSVWAANDITAHAEVNAIRRACRELGKVKLKGCTIYSTCEPCPMCFSAIHWAGIRKIVFGANVSDAKSCGFGELEIPNAKMKAVGKSKIKIKPGFLRAECNGLFKLFLEKG